MLIAYLRRVTAAVQRLRHQLVEPVEP
ncbi:polyketide synthase docking domain-containing protein [Aeromonas veronii]